MICTPDHCMHAHARTSWLQSATKEVLDERREQALGVEFSTQGKPSWLVCKWNTLKLAFRRL